MIYFKSQNHWIDKHIVKLKNKIKKIELTIY